MNQRAKHSLSLLLVLAMLLGLCGTAWAAEVTGLEDPTVSVTIDGEDVELADANGDSIDPVMIDGSIYLPLRAVAEALGLGVEWIGGERREAQLTTGSAGSAAGGSVFGAPTGSAPTELVFAEIESGPIVGFTYKGVNTFRGIPYAQAERHKAPEKPDPWTDIRPCFNYGYVAHSGQNEPSATPFADFLTPSGYHWVVGEDCQNLNVWSPSMNSSEKLPVLVFMHGGNGNAQELEYYDGTNLAASGNLVFVTINHRESNLDALDLSAYGAEYQYSAYCKYLDIIAGLEWVRDNIANFGGDPNNVTLMGQSAGTGDVQNLMGMPKAWGLYDKIVLNSGGSMRSPLTATHADTQAEAAKVVAELGLTAETIGQIADIPYEDVLAAISSSGARLSTPQDDDFYPEPVYTAEGGEIETNRSIPMMISTTYAEFSDNIGGMLQGYNYDRAHFSAVTESQVMEMLRERYGDSTDTVIEMYRAAYPTHDLFDALYINVGRSFGRDYNVVEMRGTNTTAPTYHAVYCYKYPLFGGSVCQHTNGDLPYIFNNLEYIHYQLVGDEAMAQKVADEASTALANFCRTGNPNGAGVPNWPAFTEANGGMTMFFDRTSEARSYHLDDDLLTYMAENRVQQ